MDLVFVVRHKLLVEGRSARDVARELGISRNTVRRYVEGAVPGYDTASRATPVLDAVRGRLEALLQDAAVDGRQAAADGDPSCIASKPRSALPPSRVRLYSPLSSRSSRSHLRPQDSDP